MFTTRIRQNVQRCSYIFRSRSGIGTRTKKNNYKLVDNITYSSNEYFKTIFNDEFLTLALINAYICDDNNHNKLLIGISTIFIGPLVNIYMLLCYNERIKHEQHKRPYINEENINTITHRINTMEKTIKNLCNK